MAERGVGQSRQGHLDPALRAAPPRGACARTLAGIMAAAVPSKLWEMADMVSILEP